MWSNFTVYFNRFYNAKKAFEEGEEEIKLNQEKALFAFKEEKLPAKANKNFDNVIKFSSKILQFNKDSKYVNEAIYMIAKSYYYKGQYNKALRKFKELDGLNDKEFGLSTKLWMAKSELQMRNFVFALEHLDEVKKIARAKENNEVLFEAYLAEIGYLIYREEFSKAVTLIEELSKLDLDDEVHAEVTYELGMLYVSLENYDKAVIAFESVEDRSPSFEIEFKSRLEYAKVIKHLDREEEALEILNDLRDDSKYEPYWDLIDLEIAQIHLDNGDTELALEIFYTVDTGYSKNESSGIAAFMQGDIIEHIYMDYDSAKILYEKVATKKAPIEYKREAKIKTNLLKSRKDYSHKIFIEKKEYQYLLDTALFVQDSIAYAGYMTRRDSAQQIADEKRMAEEEIGTGRRTNNRGRSRNTRSNKKSDFIYEEDSLFTYEPRLPIISADTMRSNIAKNEYELGNLYFTDLLVPDSAFFYYNEALTKYPNTKYHANILYAMGSYYLTVGNKAKADSLFQNVYDNYKSNSIAKAAAIRLGISTEGLDENPALKKYLVAENLIEKNEYYDAIEELNNVYQTYPKSEYAPKALYSIGWIYENEFTDFEGAIQYYDTLKAKYPKTEYTREIKPRLTFYHVRMKAIQDSIELVEKAIADSIRADSLAQFKIDSLANVALNDSTSILDSTSVSDSTMLLDTTMVSKDSTNLFPKEVKSDSLKEEVKNKPKTNIVDTTKGNKVIPKIIKEPKVKVGNK
jgi:tetratricopeptide (TPR) repeat protein